MFINAMSSRVNDHTAHMKAWVGRFVKEIVGTGDGKEKRMGLNAPSWLVKEDHCQW
jgi:hypothetical protein